MHRLKSPYQGEIKREGKKKPRRTDTPAESSTSTIKTIVTAMPINRRQKGHKDIMRGVQQNKNNAQKRNREKKTHHAIGADERGVPARGVILPLVGDPEVGVAAPLPPPHRGEVTHRACREKWYTPPSLSEWAGRAK